MKRTIKQPISDKIKEYNKLIVTNPNSPKTKELKVDIDYFFWGISKR